MHWRRLRPGPSSCSPATCGISCARSYRTLRDGSFRGGFPRHFVPGYDQPVPPGQKPFANRRASQWQFPPRFVRLDKPTTHSPLDLSLHGEKSLTPKTKEECDILERIAAEFKPLSIITIPTTNICKRVSSGIHRVDVEEISGRLRDNFQDREKLTVNDDFRTTPASLVLFRR